MSNDESRVRILLNAIPPRVRERWRELGAEPFVGGEQVEISFDLVVSRIAYFSTLSSAIRFDPESLPGFVRFTFFDNRSTAQGPQLGCIIAHKIGDQRTGLVYQGPLLPEDQDAPDDEWAAYADRCIKQREYFEDFHRHIYDFDRDIIDAEERSEANSSQPLEEQPRPAPDRRGRLPDFSRLRRGAAHGDRRGAAAGARGEC